MPMLQRYKDDTAIKLLSECPTLRRRETRCECGYRRVVRACTCRGVAVPVSSTDDGCFAGGAGLTTCQSPWLCFAAVCEKRDLRIAEQFDFANEAVAAAMLPCTAGVAAEGITNHAKWKRVLECLDGGVE